MVTSNFDAPSLEKVSSCSSVADWIDWHHASGQTFEGLLVGAADRLIGAAAMPVCMEVLSVREARVLQLWLRILAVYIQDLKLCACAATDK